MPFLFTGSQFYLSSDNLYQAQFGDGPGGVWTLWIFAQASSLVNTEQVDLLFGAKDFWTLEAFSQSTWIFFGSILNRLFSPITAFNTLVLFNFYLLSRACLFASNVIAGKKISNNFVVLTCACFPFIIWAVGGPSAVIGCFSIPLLIGVLIKQLVQLNAKHLSFAAVLVVVSMISEVVIFQCCVIVVLSFLTIGVVNRIFSPIWFLPFAIFLLALNLLLRIGSQDLRTIGELSWFGARWWHVIFPPNETPVVGEIFAQIRRSNFIANDNTNSAINYQATLLFPGFNLFLFLVLFLSRAKRTLFHKRFIIQHFLMLIVFYSVTFQIYTSSSSWMRFLMPASWFHTLLPVTRYSGRFTVVTHIAVGILIVVEIGYLITERLQTHRFKVIALTMFFCVLTFMDFYPSIKGRELSSIDSGDIPPAYSYLSQLDSAPYLEIPLYEDRFPFPSPYFQYVSKQPILHPLLVDATSWVSVERLLGIATSYCSPQTVRWMHSLGFKYLAVHEEFMPIDYSREKTQDCGFELDFVPKLAAAPNVSAYEEYQNTVVYRIGTTELVPAIAITGPELSVINSSDSSNPSFSSTNSQSTIKLLRITDQKIVNFSFMANQPITASCGNDDQTEIKVLRVQEFYTMAIPGNCSSITLQKSSSTDLILSSFLLR